MSDNELNCIVTFRSYDVDGGIPYKTTLTRIEMPTVHIENEQFVCVDSDSKCLEYQNDNDMSDYFNEIVKLNTTFNVSIMLYGKSTGPCREYEYVGCEINRSGTTINKDNGIVSISYDHASVFDDFFK